MDFGLTEDQLALQDLTKKIFRGLAPSESLRAVEAGGNGLHRVVWEALAKAQLLGIAFPEDVGGAGLGMTELCLLLEQVGDSVCPVPVLPTLVMAGLPIARFGTADQRKALLEPVLGGDSILTAALVSSALPIDARPDGDGWVLHGATECVPALHLASRVLVPARTGERSFGVFLVDPRSPRARSERQIGTSGEILGRLSLDGVALRGADVLGDPRRGAEIVDYALDRTYLGQCALELGIARRALILTAKYASERHQFGRPIGTFQAVAQRAGDAYVDVEAIRLTLFRAVWLLDQGRDARQEIAVAKIVAAEAGHRVVCAAQHIHGGIGFDRDYPLHRYFLASKQNEFSFGSASAHLARLGRMIAEPLD
jgi:alkylation response protein AidB-like acyl-CoA dehydrogenase